MLLLVGAVSWIVRLKRVTARAVRARFGAEIVMIDEAANCFGVESRGASQVRGNGCLVATRDRVVFVMWVPRRETTIERADILAVETPRAHLGKSRGVPLLKVIFRANGRQDSIAFAVRDLDGWVARLTPAD